MLQFYGLDLVGRGENVEVVKSAHFDERRRQWLTSRQS